MILYDIWHLIYYMRYVFLIWITYRWCMIYEIWEMIKAKFFLKYILVSDIWCILLWYLTFDIPQMMYDEWFMMFGKLYICGYAILNIWYTAYDLWQMRNAIRDRIYLMMTMPTMMVTMVMMNGEWWMMNDELCLPSTPFELSWPKCRVNGGRRRWAAPDLKWTPRSMLQIQPQKSSKKPEIKMHPPKWVFLWFLCLQELKRVCSHLVRSPT